MVIYCTSPTFPKTIAGRILPTARCQFQKTMSADFRSPSQQWPEVCQQAAFACLLNCSFSEGMVNEADRFSSCSPPEQCDRSPFSSWRTVTFAFGDTVCVTLIKWPVMLHNEIAQMPIYRCAKTCNSNLRLRYTAEQHFWNPVTRTFENDIRCGIFARLWFLER